MFSLFASVVEKLYIVSVYVYLILSGHCMSYFTNFLFISFVQFSAGGSI